MGRPSKGWTIRWRKGRPAEVRFTHNGRPYDLGLGTRDRVEAASKASEVYARIVSGELDPTERVVVSGMPTTKAGGEWLAKSAGLIRESTRESYEGYVVQLARHFATLDDFTESNFERYYSKRLSVAQRTSLKKELSAARGLLRFSHSRGWISKIPVVPPLPHKAKGTKFAKPRRVAADEYSPEEIEAILMALPEWSRERRGEPKYPIRARFIVGYEQALRPELLNRLSVPEHWAPGRPYIWMSAEADKTGKARRKWLTELSKVVLEAVAPAEGLIFGDHDCRHHVKAAAASVLDPWRAKRFCGQHFRSARLTHLAEFGNLPGVQDIAGHERVSTTALYVRATERAGAQVIELASKRSAK